jgi:NADH-quinone oxidoreductase subunit A
LDAHAAVLWPMAVYFLAVLLVVTGMLAVSYILGERHWDRETGQPYESGVASTGSAQMRFDVKFYLVAMFFVIFDVEAVFIFAWAIALFELGWAGYVEAVIFIGILIAAFIYLWRSGALEWGTSGKRAKPGEERKQEHATV